jgi:hypothetical protein
LKHRPQQDFFHQHVGRLGERIHQSLSDILCAKGVQLFAALFHRLADIFAELSPEGARLNH